MTINQDFYMELLSDPDLLARFKANPIEVLKERGIPLEEGVTYRVMEDTDTLRHLVIPYASTEEGTTAETLEGRISKSGIMRIEP